MKYLKNLKGWCKLSMHALCEVQASIQFSNNLCAKTIMDIESKVACIVEKDYARFKWVRNFPSKAANTVYYYIFLFFTPPNRITTNCKPYNLFIRNNL